MMSFGPPRRVVKDTKLCQDRTRERQTHDESYREAHAGARFTSYTEKSLLVVKDYVFLKKNQNKDAPNFGEAFHGMADGVTVPRYTWDTARSLTRRDYIKKKKQKTWLPNGGGMKSYNAPEAPKSVAAEDCVIDVKAVKPKVDTWFRPKNKRSTSPDEPQLTKEASPRSSPPRSPQRAANVVLSSKRANIEPPGIRRTAGKSVGTDEKRSDSAVKSLTSYWNNHLTRHPFTMNVPQKPQKFEDNGRQDRGDDWRKISRNSPAVDQIRPKSVGSDGVVQEHTLVPSKVLADKKMSSVEDIITFVRRSSKAKRVVKLETQTHRQQSPEEEETSLRKPATCENKPIPSPPPSPKIQPERKPSDSGNSRKSHQHRHPLYVVRLHTRWILAFKVLTLTFRPLVEAWKRRWNRDSAGSKSSTQKYELCQGDIKTGEVSCRPAFSKNPDRSQQSSLKSKRKDASQRTCTSKIGRVKKLARRGMSDTLKFLSRRRRRKFPAEEATKTPESCFAVTNRDGPQAKSCVSFLIGRNPTVERTPLVTEPVTSLSSGPVVVYDEAKPSTAKSASLEVLPHGLRMSLYVEYQLLFSFFVVQSTLFLIALFIKWLQEYKT